MTTNYRGYPPLTPDHFRVLRRLTGWTQTEVARLAGVTDRSARRWESTHYPPEPVQHAVIDRVEQIRADARALDARDGTIAHEDPAVLAVAWIMRDTPAITTIATGTPSSETIPTALDAGRGSLEVPVDDVQPLDVVYDVRQRARTVEAVHGDQFTTRFTRDDGRQERYGTGTVIRIDRPYPQR